MTLISCLNLVFILVWYFLYKECYYFNYFLPVVIGAQELNIFKEQERFNELVDKQGELGAKSFFSDIKIKYPEFENTFKSYKPNEQDSDLLEFICNNSPFLKKDLLDFSMILN